MRSRVIAVLTVVALICLGSVSVASGADSAVSAVVPTSVAITVPGAHVLGVTVGSEVETDMSIGVTTNCGWTLTVQADDVLTKGSDTIPSTRLLFQSTLAGAHGTGVGSDTEFGTGPATNVVTAGTATGTGGDTVSVHYKLTTNADDVAGTYTATHTYTASAL